ncbi:MAG: hypothetical protein GY711_19015 [bacterium]|nr:hypothetical protein [bacterium]
MTEPHAERNEPDWDELERIEQRLGEHDSAEPSPEPEPVSLTQLLRQAEHGNHLAFNEAYERIRRRLRAMAARLVGPKPKGTAHSVTEAVHETYIKAVTGMRQDRSEGAQRWSDSEHFFSSVASMLRSVMVDTARRRGARPPEGVGGDLDMLDRHIDPTTPWLFTLSVDDACRELSLQHPQAGRLVELRFFGGLTWDEAGEVLNIGVRERRRLVRTARAWLATRVGVDGS